MSNTEDQLTQKWTSNHPSNPQSLVSSVVNDDEMLALTLRMSITVTVKQSISFMTATVPTT